ncbi:MAG: hypothetical protein HOQ02_04895 [Lysobacter sp.]|nr:hypothetical protein [Lysobacter sp.]
MKAFALTLLLAMPLSAAAQAQDKPAEPPQGFVVEHVPAQRSPDEQRREQRCVRLTGSHATGNQDRQTKGTQGIHGECAGPRFSGTGNDVGSGMQSAAVH